MLEKIIQKLKDEKKHYIQNVWEGKQVELLVPNFSEYWEYVHT
jgi:hypothetical protein